MKSAEKKLKAIEYFKDWSNYLLVTTVAATGWVATDKDLPWSHPCLREPCLWSFGISIIFGILTLALIPLIAQKIEESDTSIYKIPTSFSIFGRDITAYLTQACRPQHVLFILGIILYCLGKAGGTKFGIIGIIVAAIYGFFSKPKQTQPSDT
jgi:4-hydroxybenzoate polyprenyltransferase